MGEKDEKGSDRDKKIKGEKKAAGENHEGIKKKAAVAEGGATIVLKLDLHCEGCAKKVKRSIKNYDGVEEVKADAAGGKLTVKGKVDPIWLRDKVAQKTKKKVELELVSPQPKKDGGGDKKHVEKSNKKNPDDKIKAKQPEEKAKENQKDEVKENKPEEKAKEKKSDEKKKDDDKKPKLVQGSSVVLKIPLHCDGCAQKIKRIIKKIDGVENVSVDNDEDLVMVDGTMDMKEMLPYLKEKLKRSVDIVSPKKDGDSGGEKKGKESGGDKKDKTAGGGGEKKEKAGGDDKDKDKKKKPTSGGGGGGEDKKEKAVVVGRENKEKEAVGGGGEGKKTKAAGGGGEKKEKAAGGGGGKDTKESGDGDDRVGEKKEKEVVGGGDGGEKQVNESKGNNNVGEKGKDKVEEPKIELSKMEYQRYGTPSTHYGVPLYNQSFANQDYGVHTMYNPGYHASTSYVVEYNHPYQHHHLHSYHQQPLHVPPPPPTTYLQPPQDDHMFSDENPNACSVM